jgi:hypothetical protein
MSTGHSVLLLDDGELDDVRALLEDLGADFVHLRGGAIPDQIEPPRDLFIATSRRAMAARHWNTGPSGGPTKIGIVSEDSNTLRNMLRRIGFDLLVRRPAHPFALRLLLLRALYQGDERRREERRPIGCEVSYRIGLRRQTAILADLSLRGCRLLSKRKLGVGTRITLQLPKELTGAKPLSLRSVVVRAIDAPESAATNGEYSYGVGFDTPSAAARSQIAAILKAQAGGPAVLSRESAQALGACLGHTVSSTPLAGPASEDNRRKHHRASFEREVVLLGDEASRVLAGRDISIGGMQVDPQSGLEPGMEMDLAIYGAAREEPFIVHARVVRSSGDSIALEFDQLAPPVASRLEALVGSLPAVESLEDGEIDAVGTVVSRILEERR